MQGMKFCRGFAVPHVLESVVLRGVTFDAAVRLDKCKCATIALVGKHGAGQVPNCM